MVLPRTTKYHNLQKLLKAKTYLTPHLGRAGSERALSSLLLVSLDELKTMENECQIVWKEWEKAQKEAHEAREKLYKGWEIWEKERKKAYKKTQKYQQGFALHCNYAPLIAWCNKDTTLTEIQSKPEEEREIRLELFKMLPKEALKEIPKEYIEICKKVNKEKTLKKSNEEQYKSDKAMDKADAAWEETEKNSFHKKWCGCPYWNGKELIYERTYRISCKLSYHPQCHYNYCLLFGA